METYPEHAKEKKENEQGKYKIKTLNDGTKVEGYWKNGNFNGYAKCTYASGKKFQGEVINGIPNGYGKFFLLDGTIYEGEVKDGSYNGYGIFYFPAGFTLESEFGKTKKTNIGIISMEGDKYEGELDVSQGDYEYPTGDPQGIGLSTYISFGITIEAEYVNGLPNGFGRYIFPNRYIYEGHYLNGKKDGFGVILNKKNKIESIYRNDDIQGSSVYYYDDIVKIKIKIHDEMIKKGSVIIYPDETTEVLNFKFPQDLILNIGTIKIKKMKDIVENEITYQKGCSICLSDYGPEDYVLLLSCGQASEGSVHHFHLKCGFKWILRSGTCPLCRQEV